MNDFSKIAPKTRPIDYSKLLASLQQTFINQDQYFFDKHVPEFKQDSKFLGDYFNQLAVEPLGEKPPRFYHTFSPFDIISNKAPHHAVVFEAGELLLNIEFDNYVSIRTAAMNAVVLKALGIDSLANKKVLLFGSGRIATEAVKILASELALTNIDVITRSGDLTNIKTVTETTGVTISTGDMDNIGQYDVIIHHTQTTSPIISKEQLADIKQGAVLTSFISSTEHGEFPDEIYDSTKANIITDWQQSLLGAKDLKRALDARQFDEQDLIYVKDLLTDKSIDQSKQYTVYRSTGTPIQNLAILKELLNDS
jgi:ornithine cyclodeaminase/alanine dehydrogenase-like protein (mu-crystallin family)